ncbi:MAG: c-type cytochrome [Acidobacteriia bacterium]|nr:c-type cytochrome [Terriglobia bacterium]
MTKRRLFTITFLLVQLGVPAVAQQPEIKKGSIHYTSPTSGKEMFMSYCAVCHGKDGKGNGPAAAALKIPPADLTTLTKRNGGKFPAAHVSSTILGEADVPAHGSREMPIWGPLLRILDTHGDLIVRQRAVNLTEYVQSLQEK